MPDQFTPEQQEALEAKFNEFSDKITASITGSMNTALSGLAKRLIVDEMPKALGTQLGSIQDQLINLIPKEETYKSAIRSELDAFLEEVARKAEAETSSTPTYTVTESPAITELKKQLAEQASANETIKQRLQAAEKIAQEEQQSRQKLAEEQRLTRLEEGVLTSLRGQVIPNTERQLLSLLRQDGLLVEDNGEFKVKAKDRYDLDTLIPVGEGVKSIIESRYPHFQSSRPGTGTGAAPATTSTPSSGGKFFGNENMSSEELMAAFNDPNKRAELLKEAESLVKG